MPHDEDEAHRFCTPGNIECILHFNPIYTMSLTATPERADNAEKIIHYFFLFIDTKEQYLYSEKIE